MKNTMTRNMKTKVIAAAIRQRTAGKILECWLERSGYTIFGGVFSLVIV